MLKEKQDAYPDSFDGKTIIIECARGGPDGASMPLTGSDGYQYSLPMFCPEILETPQSSTSGSHRRSPAAKCRPRRPQRSRLEPAPWRAAGRHAGRIRLRRYGVSCKYVRAEGHRNCEGARKYLSCADRYFDNRVDKTSFLRAEPSAWDAALVEDVTCAIRQATDTMWAGYRK